MKRIAACLLLTHVLVSAWAPGGLAEAFRIPGLCDHYRQHFMESGGSMTWGEFMLLHYADIDHEEKDGGRHAELPFHNVSHVANLFIPGPTCVGCSIPDGRPLRYGQLVPESAGDWPGRVVFHPPKV